MKFTSMGNGCASINGVASIHGVNIATNNTAEVTVGFSNGRLSK